MRYCVLHIFEAAQHKLKNAIEKNLPEGRGEVFVPLMEIYRRSAKKEKKIAIFPGYVFLYTDLNMKEVHEMMKQCRAEVNCAVKELALKERWMGDPNFLDKETEDEEIYELSDLNPEETEFLELLRKGNGLLSMSYGYEEDKKYHVMEGPLKAFEDKIEKVDKHNRKAFLRLKYNGKQTRAGFECKPKTYWYPTKDTRIARLKDGYEFDLDELSKQVMSFK